MSGILATDCGLHENCEMTMQGGSVTHRRKVARRTGRLIQEHLEVVEDRDPGRCKVYKELLNKFAPINMKLDDEQKSELDGLLWDLSYRLAYP